MKFSKVQAKGLSQCLIAEGVDPLKLRFHISTIEPGTRAHAPHIHTGVEAFYLFEGNGSIEVEGVSYALGLNEAIMIDPSHLHGLVNTGKTPMRYMVIIAQ